MSRVLFGTDGIRGRAGSELSPELALSAATAFAQQLKHRRGGRRPAVVLGGDPRLSTPMLSAAIQAGLSFGGAEVLTLGTVPTPLVPFAIQRLGASGGVMVTASHNPVPDNGIKFFAADGYKIDAAMEHSITEMVSGKTAYRAESRQDFGQLQHAVGVKEAYLKWAKGQTRSKGNTRQLVVLLDCAYGATSELAPVALEQLGHQVTTIHGRFDGARINVNSGTTGMERLSRRIRRLGADVGIAFDGDGDRMLAVDEQGRVVSGDKLIALFATRLRRYRQGGGVVMTQMTNLGVEHALSAQGISVHRTEVGDSKVVARMRALDLMLGGEQSGHIILRDKLPTGDGILAAMQLCAILSASSQPLSQLVAEFVEYPQQLTNITVPATAEWARDRRQQKYILELMSDFPDVRIYVRPSGTEPKVRVLTESLSLQRCNEANDCIATAIRSWRAP